MFKNWVLTVFLVQCGMCWINLFRIKLCLYLYNHWNKSLEVRGSRNGNELKVVLSFALFKSCGKIHITKLTIFTFFSLVQRHCIHSPYCGTITTVQVQNPFHLGKLKLPPIKQPLPTLPSPAPPDSPHSTFGLGIGLPLVLHLVLGITTCAVGVEFSVNELHICLSVGDWLILPSIVFVLKVQMCCSMCQDFHFFKAE